MVQHNFHRSKLIIAFFIFIGLFMVQSYNYLLFHNFAEIFSIVVGGGIFMIALTSRELFDNHYLVFIGVAYVFVGFIDMIHTLTYKGMGVVAGFGSNLPTQLWIFGRFTESISLLIAPLFVKRKPKLWLVGIVYAAITLFVFVGLFSWKIFPDCFIEGQGLTPFKIISEYVICLLLAGAGYFLARQKSHFDSRVYRLLQGSILVTIASELSFTFYTDPYGFSNVVGHYLKIVSFYFIYEAVIVTGIKEPARTHFRQLKQNEALLEEMVTSKTAELLSVQKKLSQAQRLSDIGTLAATVAHELRNPLSVIKLGLYNIKKKNMDSSFDQHIAHMETKIVESDTIISNLLNYSRIKMPVFTSLHLYDFLQERTDSLAVRFANKHITLHKNLEKIKNVLVEADPVQMGEVFDNIIINAFQAQEEREEVMIRIDGNLKDSTICVEVSDNGVGIDSQNLNKIFTPFFTTKAKGTGLGLSISKEFVELHGGTITVASQKGKGSTFSVCLPVTAPKMMER